MKCNIVGCGKIEGGFEDGICRPCYSFITADQGKEHMSERTKAQFEQHENMTIHTNPDARAWAKFFTEKYKVWSEDGVEPDSEALMTAWFANAMMAMHDHLVLKGNPINGDHAQYLLDKENGVEEWKESLNGWSKK